MKHGYMTRADYGDISKPDIERDVKDSWKRLLGFMKTHLA